MTSQRRLQLALFVRWINLIGWPTSLFLWPWLWAGLAIKYHFVTWKALAGPFVPVFLTLAGLMIFRGRCPLMVLEVWLKHGEKT